MSSNPLESPFEYADPMDPGGEFPELAGFIQTTEVSGGRFFIGDLFQRKFADTAPGFGHHWVTFYRDSQGACWPASYLHARRYGSVVLVGGGMTDGEVVRRMEAAHREAVTAVGGFLFIGLRNLFQAMAESCEAYFGHVGDPRAYEVDIAAGFRDTGHPNLVAYFHRPLADERRQFLIETIHRLGAF